MGLELTFDGRSINPSGFEDELQRSFTTAAIRASGGVELLDAVRQAGGLPADDPVYGAIGRNHGAEGDAVQDALAQGGFDGIRHDGGVQGGQQHNVWIVFSPEQVKSAAPAGAERSNSGQFDAGSPNLLAAAGPKESNVPTDDRPPAPISDGEALSTAKAQLDAHMPMLERMGVNAVMLPSPMPLSGMVEKDPRGTAGSGSVTDVRSAADKVLSPLGYRANRQPGSLWRQVLQSLGLKADPAPSAMRQMRDLARPYKTEVFHSDRPSPYAQLRRAAEDGDESGILPEPLPPMPLHKRHQVAAEGYMELGMHSEAGVELRAMEATWPEPSPAEREAARRYWATHTLADAMGWNDPPATTSNSQQESA